MERKKNLKKKLIIRSLMFTLLLLGANTYAWFIYVDKFDGTITANVISWDVSFYDDGEDVNSVSLVINNLYPGMIDYNKKVLISNKSDMTASVSYDLLSFTLFGKEYKAEDYEDGELIKMLETSFPFKITFATTSDVLSSGSNGNFIVNVSWSFEQENEYYKLNEFFEYDSKLDYYKYTNGEYVLTEVSSDNYDPTDLYIESDYADTYWGMKSSIYKQETSSACLTLNMNLIVTQKQS